MNDQSITLFDLSDRAQVEVRGSDRQSFLHNFCTNDIKALQPGQGCEAFLTNIKGRILGHIIVSADEESLWIDSVPGSGEFIAAHLNKYVITEDVEVIDRSADVGPLCLVGEGSAAWLKSNWGDMSELPLWAQRSNIDGVDAHVRRVGFTPQPAYELVATREQRVPLSLALQESGVQRGTPDEFEALRIEAGFPHYGIDLTDANIAQEAGRDEQAISFTKGCYLGQEPIARLDALGHTNKELRVLKLAAGPVPLPGTVVQSIDGADVGHVTSAASSASGAPVALAMLKSSANAPGTQVRVADVTAEVTAPSAD